MEMLRVPRPAHADFHDLPKVRAQEQKAGGPEGLSISQN
jgi:hypothetical protein